MKKHLFLLTLSVGLLAAPSLRAQTNISGAVAGTISDPTGAVVPNATVTVTSNATGQVQTAHADASGHYSVPFLPPGDYKLTVTAPGFTTYSSTFHAAAGTTQTSDAKLGIGSSSTTVEVTVGNELLHTEDAQVSTTFDYTQVQALPNPGNDVTFYAQTTPGVVMATSSGGGYGNFSTFGLPGTSNTFTINGGYNNDPFLNIGNTGATNLMLGSNDVGNVSVVSNAYDAAYGGLGGTQVSVTTRSGENKFHGNANYFWNGRAMNANDWFNKQSQITSGQPNVPNFVNANQWGVAVGGPIWRDRTFFFGNYEGVRLAFPTSPENVYLPSALLQSCALTGTPGSNAGDCKFGGTKAVAGVPASELALYKQIFSIYNAAPGFATASPVKGDPYAVSFSGSAPAKANEWTYMARLDQIIGANDRLFAHFEHDKGFQPTVTSFINPNYSASSTQPNYNAQLGETHTFTPNLTNQFLMAGTYYQAVFTNSNQSADNAQIPFVLVFVAGSGSNNSLSSNPAAGLLGGENYAFPQGRKITQYQFQDDVSWTKGQHNMKFGVSFRRDDASDLNASVRAVTPEAYATEASFAAGNATRWRQSFPVKTEYPIAFYTLSGYAQDQWKVKSNLTVTYGLRVEHNSNPVCQVNCFANLNNNFGTLAGSTNTATAYNQLITTGQHQAFPGLQAAAFEPRLSIAFLPFGVNSHTTLRAGYGHFADIFPSTVTGDLNENAPIEVPFYLKTVTGPLNPVDPASPAAAVRASNAAFQSAFSAGGSFKTISAGGNFSAPNFTSVMKGLRYPQYDEWSLQVEHQVTNNTSVSAMYVGNHGYHEPVQNAGVNSYGFFNLPATAPSASFAQVTEISSTGVSNYNGLILSASHKSKYIKATLNYAWSHALDEISNGGFEPIGDDASEFPSNPYNLSQNYGNADYDVRHYISANYVFTVPNWHGPKLLVAGWEISGTVFHNTGTPYSYIDTSFASNPNFGNQVFAATPNRPESHHCGGAAATVNPCQSGVDFSNTVTTGFGQQHRNQFFGPAYTDSDMDILKAFPIPYWESAKLKLGAQIFNLFNHPNFAKPTNDVASGQAGLITSVVSTPTSIFGSFIGGDASPRIIQLKASFTF